MAKGARAKTRQRNVALRLKKYQPTLLKHDKKRSVRLTAYISLQKVREAEKKGEKPSEELLQAAQHGAGLENNDEQKTRLREQGHFFFVHPTVKKDEAFTVVSSPAGIDEYDTMAVMDPKDKNIKLKKLDLLKLEKIRGRRLQQGKKRDRLKLDF